MGLDHVRIQRGKTGGLDPPPPLKNHKNIGVISNTGPENHKATKPEYNVVLDHYRHASETPFKWCFTGGSLKARLYRHLDPTSLIYKNKNTHKKNAIKLGPPLTKLSGSTHVDLRKHNFVVCSQSYQHTPLLFTPCK